MTWGRQSGASATKTVQSFRNGTKSGRSTPNSYDMYPSQESSEASQQTFAQRPSRLRAQSFSLPFFHAAKSSAKQSTSTRKKDPSPAPEQSVSRARASPASLNESFFRPANAPTSPPLPTPSTPWSLHRKQSSQQHSHRKGKQSNDEDFCCRGETSHSADLDVIARAPSYTATRRSMGDRAHQSSHSQCSTASSSHVSSSASMTHSSSSDHDGGDDTSGRWEEDDEDDERAERRRAPVAQSLGGTLKGKEALKDFDSMDVSELLDETLMPMILSPFSDSQNGYASDNAPSSFALRLRQARSMPALRNASAAKNKPPAMPLVMKNDIAASFGLEIPFLGHVDELRAQLSRPSTQAQQPNETSQPQSSTLRARRQKAPLTIDANVTKPAVFAAPTTDIEEKSELPYTARESPLSALTASSGSTLTEASPKTPISALPRTDTLIGSASLRARRSHRSLKAMQMINSPPPCPPPSTPLPELPTTASNRSTSYFDSKRSSKQAENVSPVSIAPLQSAAASATAKRTPSTRSKQHQSLRSVSSLSFPKASPVITSPANDDPVVASQEDESAPEHDNPDYHVFGFAF